MYAVGVLLYFEVKGSDMPIYVRYGTVQYGTLVKDDSRVGQRTVLYGRQEFVLLVFYL
jgi:hypothetical protein